MKTGPYSEYEINFIKNNYNKLEFSEIGRILGRNKRNVGWKAIQLGCRCGKRHKISRAKPHNDNFFRKYTHKMAYILGFILADGHLEITGRYRLKFGIAQQDQQLLETIRDILAPDNNIYFYTSQNKNKQVRCDLAITSKNIIQNLIELGLPADKKNITILDNMPKKYYNSFLLGLFDGDGCLYINTRTRYGKYISIEPRWQITSDNERLLQDIRNIIGKEYGKIRPGSGNCYVWSISKTSDIIDICKNMYKNKTIYLDRKYNKFLNLANVKGIKI